MKKANKQLRQILQSDRTQIRPFTALSVPLCFFVSTIAAYASGTNGLPTVVMHPVHTFTTPVHFSTPSAGNSNPGSNNGSQAGNTGGSQSGSTGTQAGSNSGGGIHSHTQSSNLVAVTTGSHLSTGTQSASGITTPHMPSTLPGGGYQLDLASKAANIILGSTLFNSTPSVTINVGGTPTTFTSGNKVTAAEYVAIQQALNSTTGQTLQLSQNGVNLLSTKLLTPM